MLAIGREGVNETALFHVEQCGKRQNIRAGPVACSSGVLSERKAAHLNPPGAATPKPPVAIERVTPHGRPDAAQGV